jgi:hypothetical protein
MREGRARTVAREEIIKDAHAGGYVLRCWMQGTQSCLFLGNYHLELVAIFNFRAIHRQLCGVDE